MILATMAALSVTGCRAQGAEVMQQSAIRVWATGEGVRVNPETGRYLEDRRDIHVDYPSGDYQRQNAVWHAAEGRVALHAARNEFVSFQLIVERSDEPSRRAEPVKEIEVTCDRLAGPDGAELSGRNITLFLAWYVRVLRPSSGYEALSLGPAWYPDALDPALPGEPVSFDLPDLESPTRLAGGAEAFRVGDGIGPSQRNQTVWVDIYVPRNRDEAPPGTYKGTVHISWPGGQQDIAVALKVWDFALPDEIHCRGDIYNITLKFMDPELELQYYQMARRHRWQPGVAFYRPKVQVNGTQVAIDWSLYDLRMDKYFDGSAFTEAHGYWGPGYGVPIDHILLPFDLQSRPERRSPGAWPIATPEGGPAAEFEAVWLEAARQVKEHFEADAHRGRVEKILFLDGLDETHGEAACKQMVYYSELLRRATGKGWFRHRIDGWHSWEEMDYLHPYVDLWVCHTAGFDPQKIDHFKAKGVEPWFYGAPGSGSNTFLDLDLLSGRCLGWLTWKHRCGYCQWEFDWNADIAWKEAANFQMRGHYLNGNALLIYRGEVLLRPGPFPSIRLKAHRRGFQDYEYFWLLEQAGEGAKADQLVDSVVHTTPMGRPGLGDGEFWANDPEKWEAARIKAGNLLSEASTPSD